ncbi:MAG: SPOR domain-containing protein [Acidobacteriota bacterium]|nr:SPOR domain-containing protein [Acidobacteriota bacterium]MDH3786436.1 SPOR domain-containing protein [Acidobacteriota bacterium]
MADPQDSDSVREVRFEGWGLLAVVTVLVIAGGTAFYSGRLYERGLGPTSPSVDAPALDPLGQVVGGDASLSSADVEQTADHFDRPADSATPAEPQRELPKKQAEDAAEGRPDPVADPTDGAFFVQVFAGRDRRAAELLMEKLRADSFAVKMVANSEGQSSLYKVRVGGFPTRDDARVAADELQKKGYNGAWVTDGG